MVGCAKKHTSTHTITEDHRKLPVRRVHFDKMDKKGSDPFTSSREGIVEGDKNFAALLKYLKDKALPKIFDTWDELRLKRGEEGDEENSRKSKKQRKARDLYSIARDEYSPDCPRRRERMSWTSGWTSFETMPNSILDLTLIAFYQKTWRAVTLRREISHWFKATSRKPTDGESGRIDKSQSELWYSQER